MSSTAVSTCSLYSFPEAKTHCGEVHCSQNFECFLIHCKTCSQEFNLLSCSLFIRHIKDCFSSKFPSSEPQNSSNRNPNNAITSEGGFLENTGTNYKADTGSHLDLLMSMKLEYKNAKEKPLDLSDESSRESTGCLTDYQEEEDLTIDKVMRRRIIEGIINEYKKHPPLWDAYLGEKTDRSLKKQHFKHMRKVINLKFKKKFTNNELQKKINNLRHEYRKQLKKKEKYQKTQSISGDTPFEPKLWYFELISFIGEKSSDIEKVPDCKNGAEQSLFSETNVSDDDKSSDSATEHPAPELKKEKRDRPNSKILSEPIIIADIISQYKKYPFLWDQTASLYNDKYARKDAFKQITNFINNKFHKNVTDKEMRKQVVNLRSGYRRAQRKKHNTDYRISLWYYDELSFIDRKSEQLECTDKDQKGDSTNEISKDERITADDTQDSIKPDKLDQAPNYEIDPESTDEDDDSENDIEEGLSSRRKSDKKLILSLIEEYKQHPCLWKNYDYKTSGRQNRCKAFKTIARAINSQHKTNFSDIEIRNKLVQLRSSYRRVLRNKEAFEKKHANAKRIFYPQLWYFDKMTFIGQKESDFSVSRRKKRKEESVQQHKEEKNYKNKGNSDKDYDSSAEESSTSSEPGSPPDSTYNSQPGSKPDSPQADTSNLIETEESSESEEMEIEEPKMKKKSITKITKNKELLTAIIEEYKKLPCLWAVKYYTNDNLTRREAFAKMANTINQKFDTKFTFKDLSLEIIKLRSTYKRLMRRKQENPDGDFKTKIWYADLLSFIEKKQGSDCLNVDLPKESLSLANDEEMYEGSGKLRSKEHVFEIIELYKSAPILWDPNHPQTMLWSERKKTIEKLVTTLSREHGCHLTAEEFRYQVRFLRESYYRAAKQESGSKPGDSSKCTDKPFFYDRMSFLEPYIERKGHITGPELSLEKKKNSNEEFSFLIDNRHLMMDFIELYKAHGCLWDPNHKDKGNTAMQSNAYDKIMNMFLQNDIIFSQEQVISAIGFLHSTVSNAQRASKINETPVWFYENLQFLRNLSQNNDKYCSHCDQVFSSVAEYETHKLDIAGDYPYKCAVCNAGFVSRSKYAFHQITHKEPHKCDQCGFQAYDRYNFNIHMRRHKGIRAFACEHCEKRFVTSAELNRHKRMHTGEKPFICDVCGKALATNFEFRQHMKRHKNERDYKCHMCESAYYTSRALREHIATHSAERHHVCEVCGAAFKRKNTLHQHKALHLEKKKHQCRICGRLFAQKSGLNTHMKTHGRN